MTQGNVQIGKNGLTDNFILTLKNHFTRHKNIKVSVLKSVERSKEKMNLFREEILGKLGDNYTGRVVGFSIFLKEWRRNMRNKDL